MHSSKNTYQFGLQTHDMSGNSTKTIKKHISSIYIHIEMLYNALFIQFTFIIYTYYAHEKNLLHYICYQVLSLYLIVMKIYRLDMLARIYFINRLIHERCEQRIVTDIIDILTKRCGHTPLHF